MVDTDKLVEATVRIVNAYVRHNRLPRAELPSLVSSVHQVLIDRLAVGSTIVGEAAPVPAVSIKRSVMPQAIICLEDGKPFKALTRHLKITYGLSPQQYRTKWGLPDDYPMTAPAYSEARSASAKRAGFGRRPR